MGLLNTLQMAERGGQDPMSACYVRSNFPVTLVMAYKYAGMNCIKIGLPGKLSKRKGLGEVLFS